MVYQGSKNKLAKEIIPILQELIDNNHIELFIDAMCGGCNVIDKIKCKEKIACDINSDLIDLYNYAVYKGGEFPKFVNKELWDSCKYHPEKHPGWERALVSIFCSFNAKGFVGGYALNGERNFYQERLNNFKRQIPSLKDIDFISCSIYDINPRNSFIYLDPPYKNTTKYDYSKNFNYDSFWNKVRQLSVNNLVVVSEQEGPDDFEVIWEKEIKRVNFSLSKEKKKVVTEKMFKLKI